jgi:hypothetical protein
MKSGGAVVGTNIAWYRKTLFCCLLAALCLPAMIAAAAGAEMKNLKVEKVTEELALRHPLMIKVTNLQEWLGQEGNDFSKLVLYIDGMAFRGLTPALIEGDTLLYDLQRNDENKEAWTTVLSRKRGNFFFCYVPVTLGFENGVQLPSAAKLRFIRINPKGFRVFGSICLVTIVLFFVLAWRSDIIRDTGPQPEGVDSYGKPYRKTYSLARTQMAFWFFTIIIGYVFIWMVTSDFSSLTPGVIGLMGISAVTGVGAAVVDSNKRSDILNQRRLLDEKKKRNEVEAEKLASEIRTLEATAAKSAEQQALLAAKKAALAANQKEIAQAGKKIGEFDNDAKPEVSHGFLNDILSDDNGISFHRFQISVWTVVLIIIFLGRVYDTLAMPTFDATLLALMGISNGTYIGFKLPDQQG